LIGLAPPCRKLEYQGRGEVTRVERGAAEVFCRKKGYFGAPPTAGRQGREGVKGNDLP